MSCRYFLGIDAGGSSCKGRLEDSSGTLLAETIAGPANLTQNYALAIQTIEQLIEQIALKASMPSNWEKECSAGIGIAGYGHSESRSRLQQWEHPFAHCALSSDLKIACLAAHRGESGGVIILGTGSSAIACTHIGDYEYGGHGFLLGDEASGAWLGKQLVQMAFHVLDNIQASTRLLSGFIEEYQPNPKTRILNHYIQASSAEFAKLAPRIFADAQQKDSVALALINQGIDYIELIRKQILTNTNQIALIGGLAKPYLACMPESQKRQYVQSQASAETGAVMLARQILE